MSGLTLHQKDLFMELFTQMNLSDASEMTKRIEHELGIAPPRAAVARVVEPDPVVEPEPTHFDVVLEAEGPKKIQVIKTVRELTGHGLKEAKDLVTNLPSTLFEELPREEAELMIDTLAQTGASCQLVPREKS